MARLFLIPTTLSTNIDHNVLLPFQLAQIKHLRHFIVETAKVARQHLKHLGLTASLQELELYELNKHSQNLDPLIQPLKSGIDVGLLSDCGLPAIADPGSRIVRLAHQHNITVIPFIGPSSLMLALMSSGVNGQSFAFIGYLPIDSIKRSQKLSQLQELILINKQSQIIIEAPFRNNQLLQALLDKLT
ncbi:MAG: SAM-dependent methyltransferase, partial [Burkholderiales bacterium]